MNLVGSTPEFPTKFTISFTTKLKTKLKEGRTPFVVSLVGNFVDSATGVFDKAREEAHD